MKRSKTSRLGAVLALLIVTSAALLSGCASPPSGIGSPASDPPSGSSLGSTGPLATGPLASGADVSLQISVKATPEETAKTSTLACKGGSPLDGSSVGDPAAACAAVQKFGSSLFSPTVPERQCTMQYGGPQTAQITGTVNGKSVAKSFSLINGCEIADWNSFAAVLGSSTENGR